MMRVKNHFLLFMPMVTIILGEKSAILSGAVAVDFHNRARYVTAHHTFFGRYVK